MVTWFSDLLGRQTDEADRQTIIPHLCHRERAMGKSQRSAMAETNTQGGINRDAMNQTTEGTHVPEWLIERSPIK